VRVHPLPAHLSHRALHWKNTRPRAGLKFGVAPDTDMTWPEVIIEWRRAGVGMNATWSDFRRRHKELRLVVKNQLSWWAYKKLAPIENDHLATNRDWPCRGLSHVHWAVIPLGGLGLPFSRKILSGRAQPRYGGHQNHENCRVSHVTENCYSTRRLVEEGSSTAATRCVSLTCLDRLLPMNIQARAPKTACDIIITQPQVLRRF